MEDAHKWTEVTCTLSLLIRTHSLFLEDMGKTTKRHFLLLQKWFYGHKKWEAPSKILTSQKSRYDLCDMRSHSLNPCQYLKTFLIYIILTMLSFMTYIYHISPLMSCEASLSHLWEYLATYGPPALSESEAMALEEPITSEKILWTLKQIKPGKSPGPDLLTVQY